MTLHERLATGRAKKPRHRPGAYRPGTVYVKPSNGRSYLAMPDGSLRDITDKVKAQLKAQMEVQHG